LAAGEISVHPLRDRILTELQDNQCWIYTNASVYNGKIGEMLAKGHSRIYPSIDAGTPETFARIKGVNLFDKVCENLYRYSLDGLVHLKYIILPGINDDDADIDGFIALCERLKIRDVDITRDMDRLDAFSDRTICTIARMLDELQRLGIKATAPDNTFDATPNDKLRLEERLRELKGIPSATGKGG
jgi:molybdenum cofactor biosynthesis enzyme MoaA